MCNQLNWWQLRKTSTQVPWKNPVVLQCAFCTRPPTLSRAVPEGHGMTQVHTMATSKKPATSSQACKNRTPRGNGPPTAATQIAKQNSRAFRHSTQWPTYISIAVSTPSCHLLCTMPGKERVQVLPAVRLERSPTACNRRCSCNHVFP